jgi:DNA-binding GntR family transcriptional regulator
MGKSRANDVWHRLREDILTGVFRPGVRLRFEQLKLVYGVSFATLREALSRLVAENLIVADAQRGFSVTPISIEDLLDITRMRVMVESEAIRLSVKNGGEEWRTSVLRAFHVMERTELYDKLPDAGWSEAHRAFHVSLVSACKSPLLIDFCARLFDSAVRYRNISMRHRTYARKKSLEHREMMEAAFAGEADRAVTLIGKHIWETTNNVIAAIEQARSEAPSPASPAGDGGDGSAIRSGKRQAVAALRAPAIRLSRPGPRNGAPRNGAARKPAATRPARSRKK